MDTFLGSRDIFPEDRDNFPEDRDNTFPEGSEDLSQYSKNT